MRSFRRVDSGKPDVNLGIESAWMIYLDKLSKKPTVLPFRSAFFSGIFRPGSHPHPASLPPGVWKRWKLSASPTLVTVPNKLLFLKKPGRIWVASGIRRRYER